MCGIVGLQLRGDHGPGRLGGLISSMLAEVRERGPDSAGVALYGDPELTPAGQAAVSVLAAEVPAPALAARLGNLPGLRVTGPATSG